MGATTTVQLLNLQDGGKVNLWSIYFPRSSLPPITQLRRQAWIIVLGAWDQTFCAWQKIAQKSQKSLKNRVKSCKNRVYCVKVPGEKRCLGSRIPGSRILS